MCSKYDTNNWQADMSLLFAIFHREFVAVYQDLQSLKRQSKFQRVSDWDVQSKRLTKDI
jgi:hypothetical protein